MIQLYFPEVFASLFPQYVQMCLREKHSPALIYEVHHMWQSATAHIRVGYARFSLVKTGSETMAGYGNFTFSSLRIDSEDMPAFEAWREKTVANPLQVLEDFAGAGFKMSVSYVIDQNSYCVTVVGTKDTKRHESMGMSSWSDDLAEALAIAWYKHFVMCGGGDWPTKGHGQRWG